MRIMMNGDRGGLSEESQQKRSPHEETGPHLFAAPVVGGGETEAAVFSAVRGAIALLAKALITRLTWFRAHHAGKRAGRRREMCREVKCMVSPKRRARGHAGYDSSPG
jgi:hypothetical protein